MDPSPQLNTFLYWITLTSSQGFCDAQEDQVVQWHRRNSEKVFLVSEFHESGEKHFHSVLACFKPKIAGKVTEKLVRLYRSMEIDVVTGVTIKVKRVNDFVGILHYLCKDLVGDPLLLIGWRMSWIKAQCLANVKKMPHKVLLKNKKLVTVRTAVDLVVQFASAGGYPLTGVDSFATVTGAMVVDGFRFGNVRLKPVFCQVMAVVGSPSYWREHVNLECM